MAGVKTIAIIGASGNMGSAIAKSLSKKGNYRLLLMSSDLDKLVDVKSSIEKSSPYTEVFTLSCARDASWEADIIILATPYEAEREIAEKICEVSTGKIVISISNPLNSTYDALLTPPDMSAAEELQKLLPNAKVVKTFNTVFAEDFIKPVSGKKVDAFIAGNNGSAVETVSEIVEIAGFNPVLAGDISASRTLEQMPLLLTRIGLKKNFNRLAGRSALHS